LATIALILWTNGAALVCAVPSATGTLKNGATMDSIKMNAGWAIRAWILTQTLDPLDVRTLETVSCLETVSGQRLRRRQPWKEQDVSMGKTSSRIPLLQKHDGVN